jgi:hypothetical protein
MKKLISTIFLVVGFVLVAASGFEISGNLGIPNLPWSIALGVAAQAALFAAGNIASPKNGKVGLFRAAALVFYMVQSIALPVLLFGLIYGHFARTELLDSNHLVWALVQASSAVVLILISAKVWSLFKRRTVTPIQ